MANFYVFACVFVSKKWGGNQLIAHLIYLCIYYLLLKKRKRKFQVREERDVMTPMPTATVTNFVKACRNEVNLKLINNCSGKYAENIIFWKYFFDLPVEQCHLTQLECLKYSCSQGRLFGNSLTQSKYLEYARWSKQGGVGLSNFCGIVRKLVVAGGDIWGKGAKLKSGFSGLNYLPPMLGRRRCALTT